MMNMEGIFLVKFKKPWIPKQCHVSKLRKNWSAPSIAGNKDLLQI